MIGNRVVVIRRRALKVRWTGRRTLPAHHHVAIGLAATVSPDRQALRTTTIRPAKVALQPRLPGSIAKTEHADRARHKQIGQKAPVLLFDPDRDLGTKLLATALGRQPLGRKTNLDTATSWVRADRRGMRKNHPDRNGKQRSLHERSIRPFRSHFHGPTPCDGEVKITHSSGRNRSRLPSSSSDS